MRGLLCLLMVIGSLVPFTALGKAKPPKHVAPLVYNGVEYSRKESCFVEGSPSDGERGNGWRGRGGTSMNRGVNERGELRISGAEGACFAPVHRSPVRARVGPGPERLFRGWSARFTARCRISRKPEVLRAGITLALGRVSGRTVRFQKLNRL